MEDYLPITVAGEEFICLAAKAILWPRRKTLLIADLHWGKAETFQKAGVPVSSALLASDLARLSQLVSLHTVERILVLGDLIHTRQGLTLDLQETVALWRLNLPIPILLIQGNHDRPLPRSWQIEEVGPEWQEDLFLLSHSPVRRKGYFTWSGHLHPCVRVGSRVDRMRLPCFWLQEDGGILPSFGSFTGGALIQPGSRDRIIAIAEDRLIALQ